MSELIQKHDNCATIRWKLLTGVSALALTAYVSSAGPARAEDTSQPQVWIELGGQLNRLGDGQETFSPVFSTSTPARPSIFSPSQKFEYPPRFSLDEYGSISFQPEAADWMFSASIRYGRSGTNRHVRQQSNPKAFVKYYYTYYSSIRHKKAFTVQPGAARFADTNAQNSEHHGILDFQAGKDVGLGMFGGKDGSSVINLGVRFAQFASQSNVTLQSDPDWHFHYLTFGTKRIVLPGFADVFHSNSASLHAERNFHGVGPSLSWSASAPVAGSPQSGELSIDWGVNAALLFGRQRTKIHHQTTGRYHGAKYYQGSRVITHQPTPVNTTRIKSVTVPNVGGFAGLSFRYTDAKISVGYRADMFFNAIDGGIDARKSENRGFFGPYASISIGIGD